MNSLLHGGLTRAFAAKSGLKNAALIFS